MKSRPRSCYNICLEKYLSLKPKNRSGKFLFGILDIDGYLVEHMKLKHRRGDKFTTFEPYSKNKGIKFYLVNEYSLEELKEYLKYNEKFFITLCKANKDKILELKEKHSLMLGDDERFNNIYK